MRSLPLACLLLAALPLGVSRAWAEFVDYSYHWSMNPRPVVVGTSPSNSTGNGFSSGSVAFALHADRTGSSLPGRPRVGDPRHRVHQQLGLLPGPRQLRLAVRPEVAPDRRGVGEQGRTDLRGHRQRHADYANSRHGAWGSDSALALVVAILFATTGTGLVTCAGKQSKPGGAP